MPISKPNYLAVAPVGMEQDFFAFAGEVDVDSIIDIFLSGEINYGEIISLLDPLEIGIARDVFVGGPLTQDVDINTVLAENLTVNVDGTPAGTDVFIVSTGEINGDPGVAPGAGDLFFMGIGYVEGGVVGSDVVHTAPATAPFEDLRYLVAVVALGQDYNFSALVDRSDFTPPTTLDLNSFFSLLDLDAVQGAVFGYSDAYNPGVSPVPDLQVSDIAVVEEVSLAPLPCDPAPTVEVRKTIWTVYAPGDELIYELPMLPDDLPMHIPNPLGTPASDWLEWTQYTFALELAGAFDFNSYDFDTFVETVTGVSSDSADFSFDSDGDGLPFPYDNCPAAYNPGQEDLDGDGVGDACEPDADGDGYRGGVDDCDDTNPDVNPGAVEGPPEDPTCSDDLDNDCDGDTDLDDPDCMSSATTTTLTVPTTTSTTMITIAPTTTTFPPTSTTLPVTTTTQPPPITTIAPTTTTIPFSTTTTVTSTTTTSSTMPPCWDWDLDGYLDEECGGDDCDDSDWSVNPGAVELCDNGIDDDCDDLIDMDDPDCGSTIDVSIYQIQNPDHPEHVPSGTPVTVSGVIVTAVVPGIGAHGFWVEEPTGGAWSGIYVFDLLDLAPQDLAVGDELTIRGKVTDFYGLTELSLLTSVVRTAQGLDVPAPVVVEPCDIATGGALGEIYEGVLVRMEDVEVTDPDLGYGEYELDGCLRVDDMLIDYEVILGEEFAWIAGIHHYYYDYKIEPRSLDDILPAPPCADLDGDGCRDELCGGDDCDDENPDVNPGAAEVCAGGIDDDCDGLIDSGDPDCPDVFSTAIACQESVLPPGATQDISIEVTNHTDQWKRFVGRLSLILCTGEESSTLRIKRRWLAPGATFQYTDSLAVPPDIRDQYAYCDLQWHYVVEEYTTGETEAEDECTFQVQYGPTTTLPPTTTTTTITTTTTTIPEHWDKDGDGYIDRAYGGDDCDDRRADVNPGATEGPQGDPTCFDKLDNDCDRLADAWDYDCCDDADGDHFTDAACGGADCDDGEPLASPGMQEIQGDGIDNDCDGEIDETCFVGMAM